MRIEEMVLTPKVAQAWWDTVKQEPQRKFREHHALKLAGIIERGEWQRNHDMFMHSKDGHLGNGQHRAAACVKAGKSVPIVVAWDCTEAQILAADQGGLPRGSSDALHYYGFTNTTHMAALVNTIHRDVLGNPYAPSLRECIKFATDNREALEACLPLWRKCGRSHCPVEPGILAAVRFLATDKDKAAAFCDAVADGVSVKRNSPVHLLLKKMADNKESRIAKFQRRTKVALVILAFRAFAEGKEEMSFLRFSPGQGQDFPNVP